MPVRARHQFTAAVFAAMALLVTGCGTDDPAPAEPPPSPTALTVAPPSATPEGTAADQAELSDAVSRYLAVYDSVYNDPTQDLAVVDTVAGGEEAASLRDQAAQVVEQGLVSSGRTELVRLTVDSLTPSPVADGPITANVTTCNDVSDTTGVDPSGVSVIDPNRLPQTQAEVRLQNPTPDDPAGWRVIQVRTGPTLPCDPT